MARRRRVGLATVAALLLGSGAASAAGGGPPSRTEAFSIRGVEQTLHLSGTRGGKPVIVTSGDGGWVHLGPDVAGFLASEGYFVVGFDAKAYLSSFTSKSGPLQVEEVPRDYAALVEYAARGGPGRPLLVGVSEGAGLSVLAATAPEVQPRVAGVVALGLPDQNELGWRWRDSMIYVTRKTPNEPLFSAREVVARVSPVPLAAIHSTHDEFVALSAIRDILAQAREPKQLWVIEAADHRFSDNQPELQRRLKEAIAWIESQGAPRREEARPPPGGGPLRRRPRGPAPRAARGPLPGAHGGGRARCPRAAS